MSNDGNEIYYDSDAEVALIGCALLDPQVALAANYVKPKDFTNITRRLSWEAIQVCAQRGEVDTYLVADEMSIRSSASADEYICDLLSFINAVTYTAYAESYAKIIVRKSQQRELKVIADEIASLSARDDVQETCQYACKRILDVMQSSGQMALMRKYPEILDEYFENELEPAVEDSSHIIKSGFKDVDKIIGGFKPGSFVIVAARPAMGKSAFGNEIARRIAYGFNKSGSGSVLHITLEMTMSDLIERNLAARMKDIDTSFIRAGFRSEDGEFNSDAFNRACHAIQAEKDDFGEHYIGCDRAGATLQDISMMAMQVPDLKVMVVDQLTNIKHRAKDEYTKLTELSLGLKELAMRQKIVIICLTQLNREVEKRQDKRPMMSDLLGSGHIEQDADIVFGLYRPEYYYPSDPDDDKEHPAYTHYGELLFIKQRRNKSNGIVPLWWHPQAARYSDWLPDYPVDSVRAYVNYKESGK